MRGVFAACLCAGLLGGCAAAGLSIVGAGAGVALGTGVEQSLSGITYKTFTAPAGDVHVATLQTLERMDMALSGDTESADGWTVTATAADREINIGLKRLTPNTTRMRVVASQTDWIFMDAATATEIILQTAQTIDANASRVAASKAVTKTAKSSKRR